MICRQCARRLARQCASESPILASTLRQHRPFIPSRSRFASTVSANNDDTTVGRPHDRPAATSTSAAQPFSAGTAPKPAAHDTTPAAQAAGATTPAAPRVKSIAPEGTVLRGINFMKNQQDPVALADEEYPDWLWRALDKKEVDDENAGDEADLFSKSKKQRRRAAKALRKRQLANPELLQLKIPLHEQTIDIYAGDGTLEGAKKAGEARQDLTKALREARRAKIKETNFLKAMR